MHQGQALFLDLLQHNGEDAGLRGLRFGQEDQTGSVLTLLRDGNTLQQDKLMGNLYHDSCAITCLIIGTLCAAVTHVL